MARLKIKAKKRSTDTGEKSQPASGSQRLVRQRRQGGARGGVVLAVLGWLVALALLAFTVVEARNTRQAINRGEKEKPARADEINADCQDRIDALAAEKKAATTEYNQKIELQDKLTYDIRSLGDDVEKELKPRADEVERGHKQLSEDVKRLRGEGALSAESVADLKRNLAKLEATVAKKRAVYVRLEKAMKAELMELREKRNTRELTHWYRTHKRTVFGPAAGVFAAELMYEKRQVRDALKLYQEILEEFPDKANPYLDHCKQRIQRIQGRERYGAAALKVNRYAPSTQGGEMPDANH